MTNIMVNLVYTLHLYTTNFDRKTCSTIYFRSLGFGISKVHNFNNFNYFREFHSGLETKL